MMRYETPTHRLRRGFPKAMGIALLALALFIAPPAYAASFQVSPTRFEFSLSKRFTNFFTLTNIADKSLRVRVYAQFVEIDEKNQIVEKVGHPHDLSRWAVFNPRLLTIRPRQKRTVRFSIRPPRQLGEGEYRAVIFFEELPSRAPASPGAVDNKKVELQLTLLTRVGVSLYGMRGEPRPEAKIEPGKTTVTEKGLSIANFIENLGNTHLNLQLKARLVNADGDEIELPDSVIVIQRDKRKRWEINTAVPPSGKYRLVAVGTNKGEEVLNLDVPVEVGAR